MKARRRFQHFEAANPTIFCRHTQMRSNFVAARLDGSENGLQKPGNLRNVESVESNGSAPLPAEKSNKA